MMQKHLCLFIRRTLTILNCFFFVGLTAESTQAAVKYEPSPVLNASAVLPEFFFKSDQYKIDQRVRNDGLVNSYRVSSPHGNFEVTSTVALYKLVGEIEAIAAMVKVEESDSYKTSLKESGTNTVAGVKNLVADPVSSVKGAGKGLSSLFSRAGEAMFQSSPGETEESIQQTRCCRIISIVLPGLIIPGALPSVLPRYRLGGRRRSSIPHLTWSVCSTKQ